MFDKEWQSRILNNFSKIQIMRMYQVKCIKVVDLEAKILVLQEKIRNMKRRKKCSINT